MTCPITDLPTQQCACPKHHIPGVISVAALEKLAGRRMPEVRMHPRAEPDRWGWRCPICDFRTEGETILPTIVRHATGMHPGYLPDRQTVAEMLEALPALVREAIATLGAPNPDAVAGRGVHRSGWQPPAELWTIDALRPDDGQEAHGSALITRLCECSRLIWDALDADTRTANPQPDSAAWDTEIAWLSRVWPVAQAVLAQPDFAWIEDEIKAVRATLAALCRLRPRPRNLCPDCRAPMRLGEDDWMTCDAGHQHPGPKRLERQWRRKAPMPSAVLCEALRVPRGTLRRWAHEGRIKPTRTDGQTQYWLPWDVIALRYPDVVAAIDARDTAA